MMKTTRIYIYIYISEDVLDDMPEVSPGKCQNMSEYVRISSDIMSEHRLEIDVRLHVNVKIHTCKIV